MKYKKEELIPEVVKARIAEARLKKLQGEWGWFGNSVRQEDYQVIMKFLREFPMRRCSNSNI